MYVIIDSKLVSVYYIMPNSLILSNKNCRLNEASKKQHEENEFKQEIGKKISSKEMSLSEAAKTFDIPRGTLNGWMRNKEAFLKLHLTARRQRPLLVLKS